MARNKGDRSEKENSAVGFVLNFGFRRIIFAIYILLMD